jgi:LysM repeat protein
MPTKGKSSFFFKVLMILTVHVVLIGGMLLQGCKNTNSTADNSGNPPADTSVAGPDTNAQPVTPAGISNAVASSPTSAPPAEPIPTATTSAPPPLAAPEQPPVVSAPVAPPAAPVAAEGREYTIVSGDTLGALARKNGISLKTLLEANPGVNPRKLHVGQKIQLPGGGEAGAVASTGGMGAPAAADMGGDTSVYTVKSGDTLSKIARANHTSYKKIMALNDLKTTSIRVGQKLKLPESAEAPAAPAAPTAPTAVVPLPPSGPVTTTAAAPAPTSNQ